MRTTVELSDELYERSKALADQRGSTVDELIAHALEREVATAEPPAPPEPGHRVELPVIPWKGEKKLDLSNFDFDELLD